MLRSKYVHLSCEKAQSSDRNGLKLQNEDLRLKSHNNDPNKFRILKVTWRNRFESKLGWDVKYDHSRCKWLPNLTPNDEIEQPSQLNKFECKNSSHTPI